MKKVTLSALEGIPLIQNGDNIGLIISDIASKQGFVFENGDIIVIASKIISKAEGRLVDTETIVPSEEAISLSRKLGMDSKHMEVILRETKRILIARPDLLLTEQLVGFINTKAGVDSSNTADGPKGKIVALLPKDPDSSAENVRKKIKESTGKDVAIVINDTFGRPDRKGSVGMAIGISGIAAIYSPLSKEDIFGRKRHPEIAQIDEISAAASLLMGQTSERRPVVVARGIDYLPSERSRIRDVLHPTEKYVNDARDIVRQMAKRK